jgi:hypothetical protein
MLRGPSCQSRQVSLDLSCVTRVVYLTGKFFDYLTSHFDYYIVDHLIGQNFIHFFLELLQNIFFV